MEKKKSEIRIHFHPPKRTGDYSIAEIYEEYREPVIRIFNIMLKEKNHWAEDLCHETFLRVIEFERHASTTRIETSMIGALLSFFAKQSYVQYKRDQGEADLRNYDDDPFVLFEYEIDSKLLDCLNPAEIHEKDSRIQEMFDKINLLNELDHNILTRIFIDNIPMRDVAAELGLSYSNLRKRLQRARERLGGYEVVR